LRKRNHWNRLDNAAKIFPSATSKDDTKVIRFSCELTELIDAFALKAAVDKALQQFPIFSSTLKRGLFWYYFEASNIEPVIEEESKAPCSTLYIDNEQLLFEVTYYLKRINLEVHHSLADGMGAYEFLQCIVMHYLKIKHPHEFENLPLGVASRSSKYEKTDDSFDRYFLNETPKKPKQDYEKAYLIKGGKYTERQMLILQGVADTKAILEKARQNNASITEFLSAVFICSIFQEMKIRERTKKVVLSIPVNLRKFFPSVSTRNFFSVFDVSYKFEYEDEYLTDADFTKTELFKKVLDKVKKEFSYNITKENFQKRINYLMWAEKNIISRISPLILKDIVLKAKHNSAHKKITATLSNLGNLTMPAEAKKYIKNINAFISTSKMQMVICSYENDLTMSVVSKFINTNIQKNFFKALTAMGLNITIYSNQPKV